MRIDQVNLRQGTTVSLDAESQSISAGSKTLRALGYRQGVKSLADGGALGNSQSIRIRPGAMRAFARGFVGRPLLVGHDVGDVTKRMGTIVGCQKCEDTANEIGLEFEIELNDYGKSLVVGEQVAEFSIGFSRGEGSVTCTICKSDLWSRDCMHWPGMTLEDGRKCEVEFSDPEASELSAVNIGAVRGTKVLQADSEEDARADAAVFSLQFGRQPTDAIRDVYLAHRLGEVFAPPKVLGSIEPRPVPNLSIEDTMRTKLIAKYGLSADATDDQIEAAMSAADTQNAASQKALEIGIVDEKLAALKVRGLSDHQGANLRAQYELSGLKAFTNSVALVDTLLPTQSVGRAVLQSDAPAIALSTESIGGAGDIQIENMWKENPELRQLSKKLGLSRENVIAHAPERYRFASPEVEKMFRSNLV